MRIASLTGGLMVALLVGGCTEEELNQLLVVTHDSETISAPETWSGTHEITGGLTINATLTISSCTTIKLGTDADISVADSGALIAVGTADCPVTFESAKATPAAGDWQEINIYASSDNSNRLNWVQIKHGGSAGYGALWVDNGATIAISNSTFDANRAYGIVADPGAQLTSFTGNSFTNTTVGASGTGYPLLLGANGVGALSAITTSGNGVNRVYVETEVVASSATWLPIGIPYEVESFDVANATLTVAAGVSVLLQPDSEIAVSESGVLECLGTVDAPITIASRKSAPASGDWQELNIYNTAGSGNILRYTTVQHGGGAGYGQLWIEDGAWIELDHATFTDGQGICDIDDANTPNGDGVMSDASSLYVLCQD